MLSCKYNVCVCVWRGAGCMWYTFMNIIKFSSFVFFGLYSTWNKIKWKWISTPDTFYLAFAKVFFFIFVFVFLKYLWITEGFYSSWFSMFGVLSNECWIIFTMLYCRIDTKYRKSLLLVVDISFLQLLLLTIIQKVCENTRKVVWKYFSLHYIHRICTYNLNSLHGMNEKPWTNEKSFFLVL